MLRIAAMLPFPSHEERNRAQSPRAGQGTIAGNEPRRPTVQRRVFPAIFVLAIVATPFVFTAWLIHRIFAHRERMRHLTAEGHEMRALVAARDELENRVRTLEAIVCSDDFELERRLDRVG